MPHLPPDMFDQSTIGTLVFILFLSNLFFNIDMGILPAGSIKIKQDLALDNAMFGTLGSVVYFGQMVGSILSSFIMRQYNPKFILVPGMTLNIGCLVVFTLTTNYSLLLLCRIMTGVFQIFFGIYMPVWADVYGDEKQQQKWLTYLLISTPLGVIIGYAMCSGLLENLGW